MKQALPAVVDAHWNIEPLDEESWPVNGEMSLLIVDTYSLGIPYLDRILERKLASGFPVLVLDAYREEVFVRKILEKGIESYIHVDDINDQLNPELERLTRV